MMALIMEQFLCCYNGELISDKSTQVGTSLYCSQWYQLKSITSRRAVVIIMSRAQNACLFAVHNSIPFNMETFGNVS